MAFLSSMSKLQAFVSDVNSNQLFAALSEPLSVSLSPIQASTLINVNCSNSSSNLELKQGKQIMSHLVDHNNNPAAADSTNSNNNSNSNHSNISRSSSLELRAGGAVVVGTDPAGQSLSSVPSSCPPATIIPEDTPPGQNEAPVPALEKCVEDPVAAGPEKEYLIQLTNEFCSFVGLHPAQIEWDMEGFAQMGNFDLNQMVSLYCDMSAHLSAMFPVVKGNTSKETKQESKDDRDANQVVTLLSPERLQAANDPLQPVRLCCGHVSADLEVDSLGAIADLVNLAVAGVILPSRIDDQDYGEYTSGGLFSVLMKIPDNN